MNARHFYRCLGCFEVVVLPERLAMEWSQTIAQCASCDQRFEYLGRAHVDRLIQEHMRCKCDDRCTSARGPICTCKCNGENHGAGLIGGYHIVTTDHGPIPTVSLPNKPRAARAKLDWVEYCALRDLVLAESDALGQQKRRDGWLSAGDYGRRMDLLRALRKAADARSHNGRMKALRAVKTMPKPAEPDALIPEVRAIENPTPTFEAPFSLTPEIRKPKAVQSTLF